MDITNIPRYDYDKRHWKKIYGPEELSKLAELVTGVPASEITFSDSPNTANKPTVQDKKEN